MNRKLFEDLSKSIKEAGKIQSGKKKASRVFTHKPKKSIKKSRRLPPIVIVPDKTYIDDTGNVIPTDVILISDLVMYQKMNAILSAWGKEPMGVPGQRDVIQG